MTAYAYKDGILAIDRQASQEGLRFADVEKYYIDDDGSVICGSGKLDSIRAVIRLLKEGIHNEAIIERVFKNDDTTLVHRFHRDLSVEGWCSDGYHPIEDAPFVCGGEFRFMSGAMAFGADPVEAVIVACLYSNGCDFPIDVIDLNMSKTISTETIFVSNSRVEKLRQLRPIQPMVRGA